MWLTMQGVNLCRKLGSEDFPKIKPFDRFITARAIVPPAILDAASDLVFLAWFRACKLSQSSAR